MHMLKIPRIIIETPSIFGIKSFSKPSKFFVFFLKTRFESLKPLIILHKILGFMCKCLWWFSLTHSSKLLKCWMGLRRTTEFCSTAHRNGGRTTAKRLTCRFEYLTTSSHWSKGNNPHTIDVQTDRSCIKNSKNVKAIKFGEFFWNMKRKTFEFIILWGEESRTE